ncbi:MAG: hypothetical protein RLY74_1055 [Actinomycetota bacterium]
MNYESAMRAAIERAKFGATNYFAIQLDMRKLWLSVQRLVHSELGDLMNAL